MNAFVYTGKTTGQNYVTSWRHVPGTHMTTVLS